MSSIDFQILPDGRIASGWHFGSQRMVVVEPGLGQEGFIPIPGITVCGEQLFIKTTPLFEDRTRLEAREISHTLGKILAKNSGFLDIHLYDEESKHAPHAST